MALLEELKCQFPGFGGKESKRNGDARNLKDFRPINFVGKLYKLVLEFNHVFMTDRLILDVALISN